MGTLDYYNNHSQEFYERTINADLQDNYGKFLALLPSKASILDAGCGVGRDTKYFLSQGYQVQAFDASEKMVELASKEAGIPVALCTFQDLAYDNQFDAIWAQASLLHIPYVETSEVYQKIHRALKPGGVFFASYKYGNAHMPTPERDFYNMDEEKITPFLKGLFEIVDLWREKDSRSQLAPSQSGYWLNFLARKA